MVRFALVQSAKLRVASEIMQRFLILEIGWRSWIVFLFNSRESSHNLILRLFFSHKQHHWNNMICIFWWSSYWVDPPDNACLRGTVDGEWQCSSFEPVAYPSDWCPLSGLVYNQYHLPSCSISLTIHCCSAARSLRSTFGVVFRLCSALSFPLLVFPVD